MLGDEERTPDHVSRPRGDVVVHVDVAVAADHVRDVDAPAVEAGIEPVPEDRAHARVQLLGAPVERRQRAHADPGCVAVRQPLVEVEEVALRRPLVRSGALEPVVRDAAVVHRQVADELQPATVRGAHEGRKRLVAAEQRVDAVERRRVVAMRAARGEERRQVDDVRAELLDVVEVLLDARQVAAVPLPRRVRPAALRQRVPVAAHRPRRRLALAPRSRRSGRGRSRRRPTRVPRRRAGVEREPEVVGARDLGARETAPVQPRVARARRRRGASGRERRDSRRAGSRATRSRRPTARRRPPSPSSARRRRRSGA